MPALYLYSAGSNARGQLAIGVLQDAHRFTPCVFFGAAPGALPPGVVAIEHISCGANHTLALLRRSGGAKEVWGCGDGSRGQLGPSYLKDVEKADGETSHATAVFRPLDVASHALRDTGGALFEGYTVRLVSAGWETSYAVLSCSGRSDILLSMGGDDFGNLGVCGSRTQKAVAPVHVVHLDGLVSLEAAGTLRTVLAVSTGPHHTIAKVRLTRPDRTTETLCTGWGTSRHGQLGNITNSSGRPTPFVPSPRLVLIPAPEEVTHLALGNQHTVALTSNGTLCALGSDRKRQLDGLDTLRDVERVRCTWNGTYALLRTGQVVATGSNTHSQLGRGADYHERHGTLGPVRFPFQLRPGQIVDLVCGSEHVLCIVDRDDVSREVWGWGWNEHGNLGTGGTEDVSAPVKIWPSNDHGDANGRVLRVWAGCGTSWILVER
ncbi:RCC1/BLIP-II [Pilatotrama ljubarskyi]|nr:RCC1/BLIP-II [Pilatotrama ljubarskyi]